MALSRSTTEKSASAGMSLSLLISLKSSVKPIAPYRDYTASLLTVKQICKFSIKKSK